MTTQPQTRSREIRLAARPIGEPRLDSFALVETEVPAPGDGQILVRNTWMSVDPYMRGRMDDRPSYIPPFRLDTVLEGTAIGEVVASRSDAIEVGATVSHFLGWRDYAVLDADHAFPVDTTRASARAYLGVLGVPGLTAYAAVTETAVVRPGDIVFVSAAAGAVGSIAGQLARILGAGKVIGSAGGPAKGRKLLDDLGFDAAIDYRAGAVREQLAKAAPDGVDVYIDNVGGEQLAAALDALRDDGRVALVGAISGYNATEPVPGPDLFPVSAKQLTLRGVLVTKQPGLLPRYLELATGWLASGELRAEETVFEGLDRAPEALLGVLRGANIGKMLVRISGN